MIDKMDSPTNYSDESVVAYANMKAAALYFPYVVPEVSYIFGMALVADIQQKQQGCFSESLANTKLLEEFPPDGAMQFLAPDMQKDKTFKRLLAVVPTWSTINLLIEIGHESVPSPEAEEMMGKFGDLGKQQLGVNLLHDRSLDVSRKALWDLHRLRSLPAIKPAWALRSVEEVKPNATESPEFRVSLVNANLIDTSSASWDQIVALRADLESQKKLRRLRRFLTTNYEGKSHSYIEDDLHLRLEDYDATVKKFDFRTKTLVLEAIFTSKWLRGSATGAVIAGLLGQPLAAIAAGAVGILFEVGNTSVKVAQNKFELRQALENHPLNYVIDTKEKLQT